MKRRNKSGTQVRLSSYKVVIIICLITLPSNYLGQNLNLRVSQSPKVNIQSLETTSMIPRIEQTKEETTDEILTIKFIVLWIFILLISTALLCLILGYLNNASVVKECLLLYLSQDVLKLLLLLNWTQFAALILCLANGNGVKMDELMAKVITYFISCLVLHLLLVLNALNFLKLYMTKEVMLDPPMPWNNDDVTIFKRIRYASFIFVVSFVSTLYAIQEYPKIYYNLISEDASLSKLKNGTMVYFGTLCTLVITHVISSIGIQVYKCKIKNLLPEAFPNKVRYLMLAIALLFKLLILLGFYTNIFNDGKIWIILLLYQTTATILSPVCIIYTTAQLKRYVKMTFKKSTINLIDNLKHVRSIVVQVFNAKRSSQIEPIV